MSAKLLIALAAVFSGVCGYAGQAPRTPMLDPTITVPLDPADWIRPDDLEARFRWDVLCRVADGLVPWFPEGSERRSGDSERIEAAMADTVARLGRTEDQGAAEWNAWSAMSMSLSHDRQVIPHSLIPAIHRACVAQLGGAAVVTP